MPLHKAFGAGKGGKTCVEWDTTRLPGRKTPHILRGRSPGVVSGRKRYHFLRRTGYPPPPAQKNTPIPAQKIENSLHKYLQHRYFSVFGKIAFFKKN